MKRFEGKTAVITGGNSGIGFATARAFVAEGARVLLVGRRAEAVDAAVASLGERAYGLVGDVADLELHRRVADHAADKLGAVDIYFANAGANNIQPTKAVQPADYDSQFDVNAKGVFFGVQAILPRLRDGGTILLTSSIASTKVLEGHAAYAGAKAALEAFARSWAVEFKDRGIRVNIIAPGPVNTPILGKLGISDAARPQFERELGSTIPLGRLGEPDELARAALFLASDEASFITGARLAVDGGLSIV